MSKKYLQTLEVEVIHFSENNINEVLDFICDGEAKLLLAIYKENREKLYS